MIIEWTEHDVEEILKQLNEKHFPFKNYELAYNDSKLIKLGSGGSGRVYEAYKVNKSGKHKTAFALKVIGFKKSRINAGEFYKVADEQRTMSVLSESIVKVYEAVALKVYIEGENSVVHIERIERKDAVYSDDDSLDNRKDREKSDNWKNSDNNKNYLELHFILMEKLNPVLIRREKRNIELMPEKLSGTDEKEFMHFASNIGSALKVIHEEKFIHKDIKLENIFYSPQKGIYKIGDFGIADYSEDGFFARNNFTPGYVAPEVISAAKDMFDKTADIYSLGMTMYIILNEKRFPGSAGYESVGIQYTSGYTAPPPANGSDELKRIVLKMMSFNPDDRFQSMDEVLNELDGLKYGAVAKYQREHGAVSRAFGTAFVTMGILTASTQIYALPKTMQWLTVLFFVLGILLLYEHFMIKERNDYKIQKVFLKNWLWVLAGFCFASMFFTSGQLSRKTSILVKIFGKKVYEILALDYSFEIGLSGLIFVLIWMGRKMIMVSKMKRKLKDINN